MATLALAAAGSALGSAIAPAGLSFLGATLSGAAIGAQTGALAGGFVDHALFGSSGQNRTFTGPRLSDLHVTASTEGAAIPRLYGRARIGGQVIWATDLEEQAVVSEQSGGGGKGGGSTGGGSVSTVEYRYYANFAVALAEGEISSIGRVWADGRELDLSTVTWRLHTGSESQAPDSLIVAKEGADAAPAYRGTAYIVFERMPLADYGNRLPQLSFEVLRAVDDFRHQVRGVVIIPGSGEFVYATEPVTRTGFGGESLSENVHTRLGASDWSVAIDQLQTALPNARSASLVVSWFGTDLRAAHCEIRPGVDRSDKDTHPLTWNVAGTARSGAHAISTRDGRAAFGGTPSDQTVVAAIRDLKSRGLAVTLTPFLLMDVPDGNALPDPYGGARQPAYPWRGRITVDPAPGRAGSPDKTPAAATQLALIVGTADPSHFAISGDSVIYSGPAEWTLRRQVLHYACLAKAAGGVDGFVIGSELKGLTQVRGAGSSYPFVAALVALAADVRAILGPGTGITYAADWSEYFGHQPADGSGDVFFHLDPLWSSAAIDAIGIDLYWPLADWRDGRDHTDAVAGARSSYDLDYLKSNIAGGEGFDWYYRSPADRAGQVRTPITDGTGKPWVFRYKDLKSWWFARHYDRPGGVERATPTAWLPQSKPFWIMEAGCPAVDKGANQPNVFVDPKSSETALPYFSDGRRDDLVQRRHLQALHEALDPDHARAVAGLNPLSTVYGGRMIALDRMHVYAWDARPYPAFPGDAETWGDADNWRLGHWLNGRIASAPLSDAVRTLLADYGFAAGDASALDGVVPGYVIDRIMSAREAMQPLELAFFFDAVESGGQIRFRQRGALAPVLDITPDDMVETRPGADLAVLTRGQETDLPASAKLTFLSATSDYRQSVAEARRLAGASGRVSQADLAMVLEPDQARETAETWLFESWAARERASLTLPPSALAVEPSDTIRVTANGRPRLLRVTEVADHGAREIAALGIDPSVYARAPAPARASPAGASDAAGQPLVVFLDLPLLRGDEPPEAGYVAAAQTPWPGSVAIYRSPEETGYALKAVAAASAIVGETLDPLPAGPSGRLDKATRIRIRIGQGELESITPARLLAGANAAAICNEAGGWEVIQFQTATLIGSRTYELSGLLRGQAGTEGEMRTPLAAGATFILLNAAVARVDMTANDLRLPFNWAIGPSGRDIGSPTYVRTQHAFAGVGLRPFAPAHVRGRRSAGDLVVTWIRRTRIGGDSWEVAEVPLGEDDERYEVNILSGTTVKRTLAVTAPSATYTAAQQIADFGITQASIAVRVRQMSVVAGAGAATSATV